MQFSLWIFFLYIGLIPMIAGVPAIGCKVFHSGWTPFVFVCAAALSYFGYDASAFSQHRRDALVFAAPVAQATLATLGYGTFFHFVGRAPVFAYHNWDPGRGWDRALLALVYASMGLPFLVTAMPGF